jgi:hypothetical protein
MFLESSRYYKQKLVDANAKNGRPVKVLTLRLLPPTNNGIINTIVKGYDRLDIIAQSRYGNPTMFWYIADANTEMQANDLVRGSKRTKRVKIIKVPEK